MDDKIINVSDEVVLTLVKKNFVSCKLYFENPPKYKLLDIPKWYMSRNSTWYDSYGNRAKCPYGHIMQRVLLSSPNTTPVPASILEAKIEIDDDGLYWFMKFKKRFPL